MIKRKGSARFKRAQGLGAHTPLPHAAHSLSLECPSQRNRHPSPTLAAERAREALKSVVCFRRVALYVIKRKGSARFKRAQGLSAHTVATADDALVDITISRRVRLVLV